MELNIKSFLLALTIVFSLFVLVLPNSYSQSADNDLEFLEQEANIEYEKNKLEQKEQDGTIYYDNGSYVGEVVNGIRHGRGTYIWGEGSSNPGDRYEGEWVNGEQHGQGTYTWANGFSYTGEFVNGKQTERGIYTNPDGSPYSEDSDDDSAWEAFFFVVGAAIGVAGAVLESKSSGSGLGSTVYSNPSISQNTSKKSAYKGGCGGEPTTATCSCWQPCCQWTYISTEDGLQKVTCSVK